MTKHTALHTLATSALLALLLNATLSPATVARADELEFARELDACVLALHGRLDLQGVTRIRHIVTKFDTKGLGYSLTIRTRTFSDTAEKKYSVVCVATGNHVPSRLKIKEVRT